MGHLHAYGLVLLRSAIWLVILAIIFVPVEHLFPLHRVRVFRKEFAVDLGYYFLNGLVLAVVLGPPVAVIALAAHSLIPGGVVSAIAGQPVWARAIAALVVGEIGYYWAHRLSHEVPFLWRFHAVHHSPEEIDFLVSTRAHPFDLIWSRIVMLTPLFALGLVNPMRVTDGAIPAIVLITGSLWGYFIHANVRWRLGPLEWLVATPGFHHWHHAMGMQRNCNYSTMLPWVDRVFGTHHLPKTWPDGYGIPEPMAPSLLGQLAQPFREPAPASAAETAAPARTLVLARTAAPGDGT
jgi:sterol desaturase/sphingolipid hydroxylase (fatty acid hydroxylase superfamily)